MRLERISRISIDGLDIGAAEVRFPRSLAGATPAGPMPAPICLEMSFRPNWVGLWKLQALLADDVAR